MKKILFICTGNTCRSTMAKVLFRYRAGSESEWKADSAGTFAAPDKPATPHAIEVMAERGIDLSAHRSKPVTLSLLDSAEWIVVMTHSHAEALYHQFPHTKDRIRLLNAFGTQKTSEEISDPFGGSLEVYQKTRDQIDRAILNLLTFLHQN